MKLSHILTVTDPVGNSFTLTYKYDAHYSFICEGMTELRTIYNLCGDAWILFNYVGQSKFKIQIEDAKGREIVYPIRSNYRNPQQALSEPSFPKPPVSVESSSSPTFSVVLMGPQSRGSQLRIGYDVASYIRNITPSPWTLRGPGSIKVKCKILTDNRPINQTKFGSDWKEFGKIHKLKGSHRCVFSVIAGDDRIVDVLLHPS